MDEIPALKRNLKKVVEKFNDLKKCGIDEEILIIYIRDKTRLSKKQVKEVLNSMDEFYKKLLRKSVIDNLK
jgi:uncharacterized protein YktB (UPF0637 family)